MHTLEADSIELKFSERKILSDIYVKCETGKITGLFGRNGEGKSCLMQVIYGTLSPGMKSVRFDSQFLAYPYKRSDILAYLPQFNFIPQNLTLGRIFKDFELRFEEFVEYFELLEIDKLTRFKSLSGGQRRLIEVYLIIKSQSHFTMLDEPFSHISPIQIDKIKELIFEEKKKKGFFSDKSDLP